MNQSKAIPDEQALLDELSAPDQGVIDTLSALSGDLLLLGAGGKIGHGLALMAQRAIREAGAKSRVIAVSRFSGPDIRKAMEDDGIHTIACDLADHRAVEALPDASDIVYLAGQKFGTSSNTSLTWALNCFVPGITAQRWRDSRIAFYSSGNVYPFTPPASRGPTEKEETGPVGEYAQSVLGRERVFEHFSRAQGTRMACIRLSYACEPRYGVLVDIAERIMRGRPVDLTQGHVNIIWQGDCNRVTLKSLDITQSPPAIINLSGPQYPVESLATKIAGALGRDLEFTGSPAPTALLMNSDHCWSLFGPPAVDVDEMISRVAAWLVAGGKTMGKPTHFQERNGKF
ncbi:MAG: NAD(P)-dependent oxidoreductase [Phycisphaerales bacterium]